SDAGDVRPLNRLDHTPSASEVIPRARRETPISGWEKEVGDRFFAWTAYRTVYNIAKYRLQCGDSPDEGRTYLRGLVSGVEVHPPLQATARSEALEDALSGRPPRSL